MRLRHTNTRRKEERCLVRPNNRDPVCSSDIKGSIVKVNIRCGEGKRSTTFAGDESVQRILHRLCCWFWRPPRHDRQYWYHKQGVKHISMNLIQYTSVATLSSPASRLWRSMAPLSLC